MSRDDAVRSDLVQDSVSPSLVIASAIHEVKEKSTEEVSGDAVVNVSDSSSLPSGDRSRPNSKPENKASLSNFGRILSYATPLDRSYMVLGLVTAMGAGAELPLMNIFFGQFAADFTAYSIPGAISEAHLKAAINRNALYIFALFIAKFVLGYVSMFCFRMMGIRISARIRAAYLEALFAQPVGLVDKLRPGAATDALITVANSIQMAISDKLSILGQSVALLITAYAVAFSHSWALTLACSSAIIFMLMAYAIIIPVLIKGEASINKSNNKASGIAAEVFGSIRTIKSLCAEDDAIEKYQTWIAEARRKGLTMSPISALLFTPSYFSTYASMALTFWLGVRLYDQGHIGSIGNVIT